MDIRYAKVLKWIRDNHPNKLDRWMESVSPNQIRCKQWLVEKLCEYEDHRLYKPMKVEIIGSWFGWPLVDLLQEEFNIERIRLYDIDPFACKVARKYIEVFNYDIDIQTFEMSYWDHIQDEVGCNLLINTSAEHMKETLAVLPHKYYSKPVIAVQSNNKTDEPDHINCVPNQYDLGMLNNLPLAKCYEMDMGGWKRFMAIQ